MHTTVYVTIQMQHSRLNLKTERLTVALSKVKRQARLNKTPEPIIRLSPYLSELDFSNSPVWNSQFDELIFFPSLNWIFTACLACMNLVQTRKKKSVHQTGYLKLDHVRNHVQIFRRSIWYDHFLLRLYCLYLFQETFLEFKIRIQYITLALTRIFLINPFLLFGLFNFTMYFLKIQ